MTARILVWSGLVAALAVGAIAVYSAFEYTLVPELRERLAGAQDRDGIELGTLLFKTRGCAGCHALRGFSDATIGPDLSRIGIDSSPSQIRQSIVDPGAIVSVECGNEVCPSDLMPNYGEILDEREIDALVNFLMRQGE